VIYFAVENNMKRKVYNRGIGVRKGKRKNWSARRDWLERGFQKFMSTSNSNEF
jgi:hypothetical protein